MREPVTRRLRRLDIDYHQYKNRRPAETDYSELIDQPTIVYDPDDGQVSIVYLELDDDCTEVVQALKAIKYLEGTRTGGLPSRSRIFGYAPRNPIRNDFCTATSLARENERAHKVVADYSQKISRYYQRYNPELFEEHQKQVERVLPEYQMAGSVFTSGIINKNNPLPYHFDAGNFRNVWSNMLGFKEHIDGGYLSLPEYDVAFEIKHNSLFMFDGQSLLHGVTPIRQLDPDLSYRFTIVFYSLRGMWNCKPLNDEIAAARQRRTERERKRRKAAEEAGLVHEH